MRKIYSQFDIVLLHLLFCIIIVEHNLGKLFVIINVITLEKFIQYGIQYKNPLVTVQRFDIRIKSVLYWYSTLNIPISCKDRIPIIR